MNILLIAHSVLRWLILIVALIAIIKFAMGWLRGSSFKGLDRGLASGFSGLLDLQIMIGLIFMVWNGLAGAGFPAYRIEHAVIMIIAAVVAHLPVRWKNAEARIRFRNSLFVVLDALLIILIGIVILPGGLSR